MALRRIRERKERRKKVAMSIVLSFLMVASGFGIYLSGRGSEQQAITDRGVTFDIDYDANLYRASIGGEEREFYYLPSSVEALEADVSSIDALRGAPMAAITFEPSSEPVHMQIVDLVRYDLAQALGKPVVNAVARTGEGYRLPVLSCDNATAERPVISLEQGTEPRIVSEGSCVRLVGNASSLLEVRDRFLYEYFEVYED